MRDARTTELTFRCLSRTLRAGRKETMQEPERWLTGAARAKRFGRCQFEAAIQSAHAQRARTDKTKESSALALDFRRGRPALDYLFDAKSRSLYVPSDWQWLKKEEIHRDRPPPTTPSPEKLH